jgi:hypothetical protein
MARSANTCTTAQHQHQHSAQYLMSQAAAHGVRARYQVGMQWFWSHCNSSRYNQPAVCYAGM